MSKLAPDLNDDPDRQVIPRWRKFAATIATGELDSCKPLTENPFNVESLAEVLKDWQDSPGIAVAADFVACALTLGKTVVAKDAARFLLDHAETPQAAREIAAGYLQESIVGLCSTSIVLPIDNLHYQVRDTRQRLVAYPQNPVLWTNLALTYLTLGLPKKALRAIRVALTLAPQDRFILRSASRLFLHLEDNQRALDLLRGARALKHDPWISAAEIATAGATRNAPIALRSAMQILESGRFSQLHLSELASALGTMEAMSGNMKKARQLIRRSVEMPTENSVAQEAWLRRNIPAASVLEPLHRAQVLPVQSRQTVSYEANAWVASREKKWQLAIDEAKRWQADQPFSSTPAVFGSWLASRVLFDHPQAIEFGKIGLPANAGNFNIRNNLAFALASNNDVIEAETTLRPVDRSQLTEPDRAVFMATCGLIAFRQGCHADGRALYREAVSQLEKLKNERACVAQIYWAMEELRIGSVDGLIRKEEALAASAKVEDPTTVVLRNRLVNFGNFGIDIKASIE